MLFKVFWLGKQATAYYFLFSLMMYMCVFFNHASAINDRGKIATRLRNSFMHLSCLEWTIATVYYLGIQKHL